MQICKICYIPMVGVASFAKDKSEKFHRCPRCRGETKHQIIRNEELMFGELLSKYEKVVKNHDINVH